MATEFDREYYARLATQKFLVDGKTYSVVTFHHDDDDGADIQVVDSPDGFHVLLKEDKV